MAAVPDDIEARPGSTVSLLRTIVGLYLRRLGGWVPTSDLVRWAEDLGIAGATARTAITRLKQQALLVTERRDVAGYALNPEAVRMLERGDRRIFAVREMHQGDPWCLISYSIPEAQRALRHQLRKRLQWIGAGAVAPSLWICPGHLQAEAQEILQEMGIAETAVLFRTDTPEVSGSLRQAVAKWWDLDALREEHLAFQSALPDLTAVQTDQDAFIAYVRLIDAWRVIPYRDPGLPADLLPADWPGKRSFQLYRDASDILAPRAATYVGALPFAQ